MQAKISLNILISVATFGICAKGIAQEEGGLAYEVARLRLELGKQERRIDALERRLSTGQQTGARAEASSDQYPVVAPISTSENGGAKALHRVRQGETLSGIAQRYSTTVTAIVRANHLPSPDKIAVGQALEVARPTTGSTGAPAAPGSGDAHQSASPPAPDRIHLYEIQPGETLYRIAKRFAVEVRDLQALNGIADATEIWAGQEIRIPSGPPAPAETANTAAAPRVAKPGPVPSGAGSVVVAPGDTLWGIARRHGTSTAALLAANSLQNPDRLAVGQRLTMPGSGAPDAVAAAPTHAYGHGGGTKGDPAPEPAPSAAEAQEAAGAPTKFVKYRVIAGDTVESLAATFEMAPQTLRQINNLDAESQFEQGQSILLPVEKVFSS